MADSVSFLISAIIYLSIFVKSNCGLNTWNDLSYHITNPYTQPLYSIESIERHRRDVNGTDPTPPPPGPTPDSTTTTPVSDGSVTQAFDDTFTEDDHIYYTQEVPVRGEDALKHWVDFSHEKYAEVSPETHTTLSNSHRTAAVIPLKFKFKFYGHDVTNVTIATGGFIYVGTFLHQWLTATQYVAPLMGNFDTTLGNSSNIKYLDTGDMFVVWWQDVHLKDQEGEGEFNFQAILMKNGMVKFVYKEIPISALNISQQRHPVTVGLSDAYYIDTDISQTVRRRTIYEYHRVEIDLEVITSETALILDPKNTCINQTDCNSCLTAQIGFECQWCPSSRHCSDGLDRRRQDYLNADCADEDLNATDCAGLYISTTTTTTTTPKTTSTLTSTLSSSSTTSVSSTVSSTTPTTTTTTTTSPPAPTDNQIPICKELKPEECPPDNGGTTDDIFMPIKAKEPSKPWTAGATIGIILGLMLILCIVAIIGWFVYAYTHPQTKSGLWLIEHRPSNMGGVLDRVKFWKRGGGGGEKYEVDMQGETNA